MALANVGQTWDILLIVVQIMGGVPISQTAAPAKKARLRLCKFFTEQAHEGSEPGAKRRNMTDEILERGIYEARSPALK